MNGLGQVYPWQQELWRQLPQQRLPHAILLTGQAHSGLEQLARALAARLVCTEIESENSRACAECRNCKLLAAGSHPDVFSLDLVEDSKVIKVDQIRNFVQQVSLTPGIAKRKVAIVWPAEKMNLAAANALLKTLEEPAGDTHIILASSEPASLLATIRSRCQKYTVAAAELKTVDAWLASQDYPNEQRDSAISAARGLPLLALDYLVEELLPVRRNVGVALLKSARGQAGALEVATQWVKLGTELGKPLVWLWLSQWLQDIIRSRVSADKAADPIAAAVGEARPEFPLQKIVFLQNLAIRGYRSQDTPLRQDLLFEQWLLQWVEE